MSDSDSLTREDFEKQFDEDLIKHDLKTVLMRSLSMDNDTLDAFVDFMLPDVMQLVEGYPLPKGKNVYSFRYSINMRLEGDRRVRGVNVREAKENLLRELTQETSIKDLVSSSLVMPFCPMEDIEIKDPELLHGTEPEVFHVPYAYMPRDAELRLEMEKTYDMLSELEEAITPFGPKEKAELIAQVERIREISARNWDKEKNGALDLGLSTIDQLKAAVKRDPDKAKALHKKLKHYPEVRMLLKEMLEEAETD
jgi:hypothetical protein